MRCCLGHRCETWTSSAKASALRCAMSSCERLALRYQRDLGIAKVGLRPPSESVVRRAKSDQYISQQGHDRRNQIRDRAITSRCRIPKATAHVADKRATA